jgi:quercetin dioxygenase-like cupin family protein
MKVIRLIAVAVGSLCFFALLTWAQQPSSGAHDHPKDRARVVLTQMLPKLDGTNLKATLVEVRYGPGEASPPHTHPCAVVGYVTEGSLRTQVKGEPEMVYHAGQSFYEAPNGVHLVSANASSTEPATLVAFLICDRDTPLSVDVSEPKQAGSR